MEALTNTNAPVMYDLGRFGREVMGLSGIKLRKDSEEFKFVVDQAKKFNEMRMKALSSGPSSEPQFVSLTNPSGRVIDVLIKPNGEPMVVEPKTQNTQQGIMTMVNPTNAVPVVNRQTGQPIMGYAADPMMGDVPQTIGTYGTNPQQTPPPSPVPQAESVPTPAAMPQANQSVRVIAPDGRAGIIPATQVDQAMKQGFRLAP